MTLWMTCRRRGEQVMDWTIVSDGFSSQESMTTIVSLLTLESIAVPRYWGCERLNNVSNSLMIEERQPAVSG